MKKLFLPVLLVIVSAVPTFAQSVKSFTELGYEMGWNPMSYMRQGSENLKGAAFSFVARKGDRVGWALDLSIHQDNLANPVTTASYRVGPRYYFAKHGKLTPFAEGLAGGTRISAKVITVGTTTTKTSGHSGFAALAGGGLDMRVKNWLSIRLFQVDYSYMRAGGANLNGLRIQGGGVFHFGHEK